MDCARNWGKWTEVCACNETMCNTFAYLRSSMDDLSTVIKDYSNDANGWFQVGGLIVFLSLLAMLQFAGNHESLMNKAYLFLNVYLLSAGGGSLLGEI